MNDIVERAREHVAQFNAVGGTLPFPTSVLFAKHIVAQALEIDCLRTKINTPIVDDWFEGVRIEAAHQQEHWGSSHDAGKTPSDWFWLLGYLGGKALASAILGDIEKAKHHTVSSGAAMFNWWRALNGDPDAKMRPGTDR